MLRNPSHYLDRAKYFYQLAKTNNDDNDEYVKIDPVETIEETPTLPRIKKLYQRYYDPITKHYYKTESIFDTQNPETQPKAGEIWYPENKLSYRTARDVDTGDFYNVNKVYDDNGQYSIQYEKLNYRPYKKPGTNFYRPNYSK